jgi:hypothetical protein
VVRGCEPQGVVIKDPVVVAGTDEAQLSRVELSDVRVTAPVYVLNVGDMVLEDVSIESFFGGTTFERSGVSLLGTVALMAEDSSPTVASFVDAEVTVVGRVEVSATSRDSNAGTAVVYFGDSNVDVTGSLRVVTSGEDAEVWDYCPALAAVRSAITSPGRIDVFGVAPIAYLAESSWIADGVVHLESTAWSGVQLYQSDVRLGDDWRLTVGNIERYALVLADGAFAASSPGPVDGSVLAGAGSTRLENVDILSTDYAGLRVAEGELTLAGRSSIVGTDEVWWGMYVDGGATVISVADATLEVSGMVEGVFVADGALALSGLRVHDVLSHGVRAAGPVVADGWDVRDVGDRALYMLGADADIRDSTFERSDGVLAQVASLRLRDVDVAAPAQDGIVVQHGSIDAERVSIADAPQIGISLVASGGRLADVRVTGAERSVVQSSCGSGAAPLELASVICDGCVESAPLLCAGVLP